LPRISWLSGGITGASSASPSAWLAGNRLGSVAMLEWVDLFETLLVRGAALLPTMMFDVRIGRR
jgi:hypothetical protein